MARKDTAVKNMYQNQRITNSFWFKVLRERIQIASRISSDPLYPNLWYEHLARIGNAVFIIVFTGAVRLVKPYKENRFVNSQSMKNICPTWQ